VAVILVGGGARSGKSRYALELARKHSGRRGFLATAQAFDDEMRERIAQHRRERGPEFATFEEPLEVADQILRCRSVVDVLVVDCLTLWVSNLLLENREPNPGALLDAAKHLGFTCILVTNEVGSGIVPENALARRFRDLAGSLNQQVAASADEVYLMAFGVPLRVK
jgi:adenosylcobinamide kinase/adenosylcobinamide-phosphate guanylyltransferase